MAEAATAPAPTATPSKMASPTVRLAKQVLRKELKERLKAISTEERARQSKLIIGRVIQSPEYKKSRRICVYLSMQEEVATRDLLKHIFRTGRKCFVPRYTKESMEMLELESMDDYQKLPMTIWNIRQPGADHGARTEALSSGGLDLIVMPGLGFSRDAETRSWNRLGRGKGYYDTYLEKIEKLKLPLPLTVALAFKEQILDSVPVDLHDRGVGKVFHC